jgi:hypothetical protein
MDVASWDLQTSFERLSRTRTTVPSIVETSLIRSFRKYASAGGFDQKSEWYVLAVGQHNGLPTRCLDWTASPLVAANFACWDDKYKTSDGVIWCLHAGLLRKINARNLSGISWMYDTRLLEQNFSGLHALDASAANGDLLLLWEPPSLDERIANQFGLLSITNGCSHTSFLAKHLLQYPGLVLQIIITAAMKSELRDMLDQNNISERSLFPGLPGLCAWLKRYYGAAW